MDLLAHVTFGEVSFIVGVFLLGTLSGVGLGWALWHGRSR
jgi:hypothetical protein